MKLTETDNRFWKLVGDLCFSDLDVEGYEYDRFADQFILFAPGERIIMTRKHLNDILKANSEFIKTRWKTNNNFDGKIDEDSIRQDDRVGFLGASETQTGAERILPEIGS